MEIEELPQPTSDTEEVQEILKVMGINLTKRKEESDVRL